MLWKVLGWLIALPFIGLGIFIIGRLTMCGPDKEVVKVATPMVEKIADYIVEHGVPDSLSDIPDLPYRLEGCKVSRNYEKKVNNDFIKIELKDEADYILHEQSCSFHYKNKTYSVWLWFEEFSGIKKGNLQISSNYTYTETRFETNNQKLKYTGAYNWLKHHGTLCSSFKQ